MGIERKRTGQVSWNSTMARTAIYNPSNWCMCPFGKLVRSQKTLLALTSCRVCLYHMPRGRFPERLRRRLVNDDGFAKVGTRWSGVRGQESGVRSQGQRSEVRGQESEVRG